MKYNYTTVEVERTVVETQEVVSGIVAENGKGRTLTVSTTEPHGNKIKFEITSSVAGLDPVNVIRLSRDEAAALIAEMKARFALV